MLRIDEDRAVLKFLNVMKRNEKCFSQNKICLRHVGTEMLIQFVLVQVAFICGSQGIVSDSFLNMAGEGH